MTLILDNIFSCRTTRCIEAEEKCGVEFEPAARIAKGAKRGLAWNWKNPGKAFGGGMSLRPASADNGNGCGSKA